MLSALLTLPGIAALLLVLPPPVSWGGWQYALLALEFSLFLTAPATLGLALLVYHSRRRASLALAGLNAVLLTAGHDLFVGPEDNRRMAERLAEEGVPYRHVELPWTEHMYDLNWGGLASQITRHPIDAFLREQH